LWSCKGEESELWRVLRRRGGREERGWSGSGRSTQGNEWVYNFSFLVEAL